MPIREVIIVLTFFAIVVSVYLAEFVLICRFVYNKLRRRYRPLHRGAFMLHIIALIGIFIFCYGYFIEPYWIEVNTIEIKTNKLSDTSFRIVHISDLHCDKKIVNEKKMVKIINNLEPDIIVFTGDAVNRPSALPLFKDTINNLEAGLGKYAVYGNWETGHWPGYDYYSQTDFEPLDAQTVRVGKNGETITISGLRCDNTGAVRKIYQNLTNENYNVFLFHFPHFIDSIDKSCIDLYLCGHTHGGQIAVPFYGALITMSKSGKKYEAGKYLVDNTTVYVNRGLGMDAFPGPKLRILARPEITVFDINPDN